MMVRRLRLWSGLVLFVFVLTHFVNHALGLISLETLDAGRTLFLLLWRNLPGTILLYASLIVHMALAFWAIYNRRRLDMPRWEGMQLLFGLAIPPLLILHILGNRLAAEFLGTSDTYIYNLLIYFVFQPLQLAKQILVMVVAWVHGCIGLHYWLRLKESYRRIVPLAYALALLVPTVSLAGVLVAGRDVRRLAEDPDWLNAAMAKINFADEQGVGLIYSIENGFLAGFAGLLAMTLLLRQARAWWERRHGIVHLTYPDGKRVPVIIGATILEASRGAGIPHASVCGGRGRCSTCRVRVGAGLETLAPRPGPRPTWRSRPCCRRHRPCAKRGRGRASCREKSAKSPFCSLICGASPLSRKTSCPTTWSSSSIAISQPWAWRSRNAADWWTSSSATG
jgi:adenylate cyclase